MPRLLLIALCSLFFAGESAPAQQRTAGSAQPWRTWIWVCRGAARALDDGPTPASPSAAGQESDCLDEQLRGLVAAEDVPIQLRRRAFEGATRIELDVSPQGTATACRVAAPSGEPRLDRLACSLVSARARFRPLYAAPGRPIAARHALAVGWQISNTPPVPVFYAPPSPQPGPVDFTRPRNWPRLTWWSPLMPVALPAIQASYPAGASRGGIVSLDLLVRAPSGIEACMVGVSSGDAALDEAACRVARTLELRYPRPCERCSDVVVPLQVVWRRGGGSHIRFPLPMPRLDPPPIMDPADPRDPNARRPSAVPNGFAVAAADYRGIDDRSVRVRRFVAEVAIDAEGRPTACRARRSTGNPAVDRRSCELILRRARYRPQTDVFGDAIATPSYGHIIDLPALE